MREKFRSLIIKVVLIVMLAVLLYPFTTGLLLYAMHLLGII